MQKGPAACVNSIFGVTVRWNVPLFSGGQSITSPRRPPVAAPLFSSSCLRPALICWDRLPMCQTPLASWVCLCHHVGATVLHHKVICSTGPSLGSRCFVIVYTGRHGTVHAPEAQSNLTTKLKMTNALRKSFHHEAPTSESS